jgi:hypothetical protein
MHWEITLIGHGANLERDVDAVFDKYKGRHAMLVIFLLNVECLWSVLLHQMVESFDLLIFRETWKVHQ